MPGRFALCPKRIPNIAGIRQDNIIAIAKIFRKRGSAITEEVRNVITPGAPPPTIARIRLHRA